MCPVASVPIKYAAMTTLAQVTLNGGHPAYEAAGSIGADCLEALRPLVKVGGGPVPGFAPFRVTIRRSDGGAVFMLWRGQEPVAQAGVAWTAEGEAEVWPELERLYLDLSDRRAVPAARALAPGKPAALPWLVVVLLPGMMACTQEDVSVLSAFERCLAWSIIREEEGSKPTSGTYLHRAAIAGKVG